MAARGTDEINIIKHKPKVDRELTEYWGEPGGETGASVYEGKSAEAEEVTFYTANQTDGWGKMKQDWVHTEKKV